MTPSKVRELPHKQSMGCSKEPSAWRGWHCCSESTVTRPKLNIQDGINRKAHEQVMQGKLKAYWLQRRTTTAGSCSHNHEHPRTGTNFVVYSPDVPPKRQREILISGWQFSWPVSDDFLESNASCSTCAYFSLLTTTDGPIARKYTKWVTIAISLPCTTIK